MSASFRRFEILLPLRFNDGKPVPDDLIAETIAELEQRFGAVSSESQVIHGIWHNQGQVHGPSSLGKIVPGGLWEAQSTASFIFGILARSSPAHAAPFSPKPLCGKPLASF